LSLDADAQPTVDDESSQCGSASLWEVMNMVSVIASNQQQIENAVRDGIGGVTERIASECEKTNETTLVSEIRNVKRVLESGNETRLQAVVMEMKGEMQEMKDVMRESVVEVRKMRDEMKNVSGRMRAEIEDVKRLVLSRPTECECATVKPPENSTYPVVTTSTSPPQQSAHLSVSMPPTHSFTPGLKHSFSANPSHCSPSFLLLKYSLHGFPGLFTVISEHICFLLLVFSVLTPFSCRLRAVD